MSYREEQDSMGTVRVPRDAFYGAQTQRAADNFPISGLRLQDDFIYALAMIKHFAAKVNQELGLVEEDLTQAIAQAADEVMQGRFKDQFVVDVFQTGSGTSTNMNMNEVLATRANQILTGRKAGKAPVHPNDHVNCGQSSNDVIPTAIHIAALIAIHQRLKPSLQRLQAALAHKADAFADIHKIGRTHLQDAVPMTLGQEFGGFARQIDLALERVAATEGAMAELALGGTAVGTGLNTAPGFAASVIAKIEHYTALPFVEAHDHFEAQSAQDAIVATSGALKVVAVSLVKIANDVRWLASGPRCGLGEINIPALQPGSSIMPGKVNPVIPEAVIQVAAQVIGNDTTITLAGQLGNFQLNVMLPVSAYNLLQSIELLAAGVEVLTEKCIKGIEANREQCEANIEKSLALVTGLVPHIGYDRAAEIAHKAFTSGKTVREVALEEKILPEDLIHKILTV